MHALVPTLLDSDACDTTSTQPPLLGRPSCSAHTPRAPVFWWDTAARALTVTGPSEKAKISRNAVATASASARQLEIRRRHQAAAWCNSTVQQHPKACRKLCSPISVPPALGTRCPGVTRSLLPSPTSCRQLHFIMDMLPERMRLSLALAMRHTLFSRVRRSCPRLPPPATPTPHIAPSSCPTSASHLSIFDFVLQGPPPPDRYRPPCYCSDSASFTV